jgi:hypothetical protein
VSYPPRSSRLWTAAFLLGGSALFFWQLRHPVIRFTSPVINEVLGLGLGLFRPWSAAFALFRVGRVWSKALTIVATIPLVFYSALFLFGAAMTSGNFKNGHDISFNCFAQSHWNGSNVRLYQTNGGATTDFGVVIRQERSLLPGLELVRNIDTFYRCRSLDATPTNTGIVVRDERSECPVFQASSREYPLRRFIYF